MNFINRGKLTVKRRRIKVNNLSEIKNYIELQYDFGPRAGKQARNAIRETEREIPPKNKKPITR